LPAGLVYQQVVYLWYATVAVAVIFIALLLMTKYRQRPYGRYLEGYGGIIGIGRRQAGGGMIAKMSWYSPKYLLFDAKKRGVLTLVAAMPKSITTLDTREGGVSFVPVDLDNRVTYGAEETEWADEALGALSKDHDWKTFLFRWKAQQLLYETAAKFPAITDKTPPESFVNLQVSDGETVTLIRKRVSELTTEERTWYDDASAKESQVLPRKVEDSRLLKAKVEAVLNGAQSYVWQTGVDKQNKPTFSKISLDPSETADLKTAIEKEFEASHGPYKDVLVQGRTISAQSVAGLIRGLPDAADVNGMKGEMEQRIRDDIRGEGLTMAKAMPIMIIFLGAAIAFAIIYGVVK
jgi:hypothetical protein